MSVEMVRAIGDQLFWLTIAVAVSFYILREK